MKKLGELAPLHGLAAKLGNLVCSKHMKPAIHWQRVVPSDGKGVWGQRMLGLQFGITLSSILSASMGISPGYLKYLHQHQGAQQRPAVCRTRVRQFDLPTPS